MIYIKSFIVDSSTYTDTIQGSSEKKHETVEMTTNDASTMILKNEDLSNNVPAAINDSQNSYQGLMVSRSS